MKTYILIALLALSSHSALACGGEDEETCEVDATSSASEPDQLSTAKTCSDYASYEEMPEDCQRIVDKVRDQIKPAKSKTEMWVRDAEDRHHEEELEREYERIKSAK